MVEESPRGEDKEEKMKKRKTPSMAGEDEEVVAKVEGGT